MSNDNNKVYIIFGSQKTVLLLGLEALDVTYIEQPC